MLNKLDSGKENIATFESFLYIRFAILYFFNKKYLSYILGSAGSTLLFSFFFLAR